jgi:polyisoprenoid-binding protein YceI
MMPIARPLAALALVAACLPALAAPRALVPEKSRIEFAVTQMGVEVTGQFRRFDAQIALDAADPATASAQVTVDIASL